MCRTGFILYFTFILGSDLPFHAMVEECVYFPRCPPPPGCHARVPGLTCSQGSGWVQGKSLSHPLPQPARPIWIWALGLGLEWWSKYSACGQTGAQRIRVHASCQQTNQNTHWSRHCSHSNLLSRSQAVSWFSPARARPSFRSSLGPSAQPG